MKLKEQLADVLRFALFSVLTLSLIAAVTFLV